MAFESARAELSKVLMEKREACGLSPTNVGKATEDYERDFRVSQPFVWDIERKSKVPSPFKLLTLVRLYKTTLGEIYKAIGASDEEICSCSKKLPENDEERELSESLFWILRKGNQSGIDAVKAAIRAALQIPPGKE